MNQNFDPNKWNQSYQYNQQPSSYPYHPQGLTNNYGTQGPQFNNFGQPLQGLPYNNFNLDYRLSPDLSYFNEFEKVYQNALRTGRNFVDPAFLPSASSLMEPFSNHSSDWAKLKWLRPHEFLKGRICIFNSLDDVDITKTLRKDQHIQIDDVFQGQLEDSHFLSCLSSMARNPSRIRNLFISKQVNPTCGVYCVKICFEGIWQAVFVDDYFPCISAAKGPCFAKSKKGENELWVLILEKAWAKLLGSYEKMEFGESREVLRDLTGAPTKVVPIVTSDEMDILRQIVAGVKENYIMTARSREKKGLYNTKKRREMFQSHSYSLISIHQLKGDILIKLRTPYGVGEWMGAWRDDDPVWNTISANDKEIVGYIRNNSDGIFFMRFNDFVKTFEYVDVCMVHDNYKYCAIPLNVQGGKVCVEINVRTGGENFFTLLQSSWKINDGNYSPAKISIMQNNTLISQNQGSAQRETYIETNLYPGVYKVHCECFFPISGTSVLSSYGVGDVAFKIIEDEMKHEYQKKLMEDQIKLQQEFERQNQMEKNRRMENEAQNKQPQMGNMRIQLQQEIVFRNTGFKSQETEKKQDKEMDCSTLGMIILYLLLFGVLAVIFGQVISDF